MILFLLSEQVDLLDRRGVRLRGGLTASRRCAIIKHLPVEPCEAAAGMAQQRLARGGHWRRRRGLARGAPFRTEAGSTRQVAARSQFGRCRSDDLRNLGEHTIRTGAHFRVVAE